MELMQIAKVHNGQLFWYGCKEHKEYGLDKYSQCLQCKEEVEWEDYLRDTYGN